MALRKWVKLSSERVFESQFLSVNKNVWQLPNGEINDNYYSFVRPDYVIMVGTDQAGNILVERSFRQAVNDFVYEMPAGFIESGEDIEDTARREFTEETGYPVVSVDYQGMFYPLAGPTAMQGHLVFLKFDSDAVPSPDREAEETIECSILSPAEVKQMVLENQMKCMGSIAAVGRYFLKNE